MSSKEINQLLANVGLNVRPGENGLLLCSMIPKRLSHTNLPERHQVGLDEGIVGGSFMDGGQVATLHQEVRDGQESRKITDDYNSKNGIAD